MEKDNGHVQTLVGLSASHTVTVRTTHHGVRHGTTDTITYREGWHVVADFRARVREVREHGDDHDAQVKLKHHCELIALSAVLTVLITFMIAKWVHFDVTFPVFPSFLQEVHDWIYKL